MLCRTEDVIPLKEATSASGLVDFALEMTGSLAQEHLRPANDDFTESNFQDDDLL